MQTVEDAFVADVLAHPGSDDVRLIVQFLKTLTGEYEGRPLAGSDSAAK